jgi:molybdopterin-guanine dinucleotide biosynthesis protein A
MGGADKGLLSVGGLPLIERLLSGLVPQVGQVLINANRNLDLYGRYGWPVVPDSLADFPGPLAGVLAGLEAAVTPWVLTLPCDTPRLPPDLLARLAAALETDDVDAVLARDRERLQPLYALLPPRLAPALRAYLAAGGRQTRAWYAGLRTAVADFSDVPDPFPNLNSDLAP